MLTPSLEDYLEEICRRIESPPVRPKELSSELNVSMPAVTRALQRLAYLGFVEYEAYGNVELTDKGTRLGRYLIERNAVLQRFVALICPDCDVADTVESMEHYMPPEVVSGIEALLSVVGDDLRRHLQARTSPLPADEPGPSDVRRMRRFGGKVPHEP